MDKPYSLDLRERIVGYVLAGHSARSAARVFGVSPSTAVRLASDHRRKGSVAPKPQVRRLRASVAYVGQEPFLFEDSLRYNLCWGCGPVNDVEVWQALETVGASCLARGLEGGLDGRIRAEGMRFSGGERQRLRLARALLRRPRLLVLDEATNALDLDAEARVLRAMLAARNGATVLIVSHRLGNLHLADHVILLEGRRLAETGQVAVLAGDPSSLTGRLLVPGAN